ncbi:hypothetical protein [Pontibacterium sp.]|uniref:hypothetical protein n=1 Tax=Pontibacterium sp. TaxID=2036026 RepID=UPI00356A8E0B
MRDISDITTDGLPSNASLIKATIAAASLGSVLLVTTVLPAEYGIDPTGLGKAMGLTQLNSSTKSTPPVPATVVTATPPAVNAVAAVAAVSAAASTPTVETDNDDENSPVRKRDSAYQTRTMTLSLAPGQGTEIKAVMEAGERFVFNWKTEGGAVNFDMHGEPPNAKRDEFTSYWFARNQRQASGSFTAPFKGTHGWYWRNRGNKPVKVTVSLSGFFRDVYMP